jgi:hypothetical protein
MPRFKPTMPIAELRERNTATKAAAAVRAAEEIARRAAGRTDPPARP